MAARVHPPVRARPRRALACVVLALVACSDSTGDAGGFAVSASAASSAATMASGGSTGSSGTTGGGTTAEPTVTSTPDATDTGGTSTGPGTTGTTTTTTTGDAPACGDGVKEPAEECDTQDFGGADCMSLGFDGGTLNCINCKINTLGCFACGDGLIHGAEACDGDAFGGATCESLGFGPGTLSCAADCTTIDTSMCEPAPVCGDGVKNAMENCDGVDLGGETCVTQGFDMGALACSAQCQFNTAGCSDVCKLKNEPCNGPTDCCNTGCGKGGSMCTFNGVSVCCS